MSEKHWRATWWKFYGAIFGAMALAFAIGKGLHILLSEQTLFIGVVVLAGGGFAFAWLESIRRHWHL